MDHLTYARAQMGLSLAFHMAFAAAGTWPCRSSW